ncbi:MAG: CDC27 family protein [Planctomycetota bacterium]
MDASAPEDILREAYFQKGAVKLELAAAMNIGRETWWDVLARQGRALGGRLEQFSGAPLPERTRALPAILGRALFQEGAIVPDLLASPVRLTLGGGMVMATRERTTTKDERDRFLREARTSFDAAGLLAGPLEGLSRVMIGRSLLIEGRPEEARKTFRNAMTKYPTPEVQAGALLGVGESYLSEGLLDEAWRTYQEFLAMGPLIPTVLLTPRELKRNLEALGQASVRQADDLAYPRSWLDEPAQSPRWNETLQRARKIRQSLAQAQAVYETLLAQLPGPDAEISVRIAALCTRQAEVLSEPPFDRPRDREEARSLRMRAADTYMRLALDAPGGPYDEQALYRSGTLFFEARAFERSIESFETFAKRHGQSDLLGEVRNILGLAYQNLGLYERAESVFRINAMENATAEGRKSLFYLGETYRLWGGDHLGGPGSSLRSSALSPRETVQPYLLTERDILGWRGLVNRLRGGAESLAPSPAGRVFHLLGKDMRDKLEQIRLDRELRAVEKEGLVEALNLLILRRDLHEAAAWRNTALDPETTDLLGRMSLSPAELARCNRQLLEGAFPEEILAARSPPEEGEVPQTAREVFEYVRSLRGLGPESRPWRWSTFALGEALYAIAEAEKQALDPAARQETPPLAAGAPAVAGTPPQGAVQPAETAEAPSIERMLDLYRQADALLAEALHRYVLYPEHPQGIRQETEGGDYQEVVESRFRATYLLALCREALGQVKRSDGWGAQDLLRGLLDEARYSEEVWAGKPLLARMHRNAYFYLALSLYRAGDYTEAYEVLERAEQRLQTSERPYLLYMMGECLLAMGRPQEARNKYVLARTAVRTAVPPDAGTFADEFGVAYWQQRNEDRLADLDYLTALNPVSR